MHRRHMYCRLIPLLTMVYHSTRKWGRAPYTHQQMEIAKGELVVDPADNDSQPQATSLSGKQVLHSSCVS